MTTCKSYDLKASPSQTNFFSSALTAAAGAQASGAMARVMGMFRAFLTRVYTAASRPRPRRPVTARQWTCHVLQ